MFGFSSSGHGNKASDKAALRWMMGNLLLKLIAASTSTGANKSAESTIPICE